MKKYVLPSVISFIVIYMFLSPVFATQIATINVDGNPADWTMDNS